MKCLHRCEYHPVRLAGVAGKAVEQRDAEGSNRCGTRVAATFLKATAIAADQQIKG
ncbi:MAG: hypothetical protein KME31_29435 [Tolypothrix carrinoi HA7290-LM1]|nr:hypothetical protein [Tolypothrix carrinoi HA7290-LM1]